MTDFWTMKSGRARAAAKAAYCEAHPLEAFCLNGQPPVCGKDDTMIDQVPYSMPNNWTFQCVLTGKEFPFGRDKESKVKALQEQQQHTRTEIERREKAAGRPLSLRELQHGIAHVETRTIREQVADANPPIETAPKTNWVQERIDYLREHPGHDPQERARIKKRIEELKRLAKKEAAEKEVAEEEAAQAAAIAANPKIQDALSHSATVFNDLRFYKYATQKDVEQAEQRHELAKTDPAAYWESFWPWRKDWDARADAAAKVVTDNAVAEQEKAKEMQQDAREIETRAKEAMETHPAVATRNTCRRVAGRMATGFSLARWPISLFRGFVAGMEAGGNPLF